MKTNSSSYLKCIGNLPHFQIIRTAESVLLAEALGGTTEPYLDLGCGDGRFAATLGLEGDIYGVDIDEKALDTAVKSGFYKKALKAYATDTGFEDGFFNTVFSNCAVEHMNNLLDVLNEVRRVLKPGGVFVLTVPSSRFMDVVKADKVLEKVGLNTDAAIAEYNSFHNHVNVYTPEQWAVMFGAAGLKVLTSGYYLPGEIGQFVVRIDMLYTVETPGSKELLKEQEKRYKSLSGMPFRRRVSKYLKDPHGSGEGTHLIMKVQKV